MRRLKKGDEVIVTAGKDKGKRGTVLSLVGERVFVDGVNMVKKHQKGNPNENIPGGIVEKEAALHASNVMLFNPETSKGDRIGYREDDGTKVRYFKSNNAVVD